MTNRLAGVVLAVLAAASGVAAQHQGSIEARLAAAKLAETRGDVTAAEAELRGALAEAAAADRARVQAELDALLARQGRASAPAAATPAGDPVQRLIATLEQGSDELPQVAGAIGQLGSLGVLAVPPLLEALPKLGPFGLSNTLRVLARQGDPRIAPALLRRLDDADPAVAAAIVRALRDAHRDVAVPVAVALARQDGAATRLAAVRMLVQHQVEPELARSVALRLAQDPAHAGALLELLHDSNPEPVWAVDVYAALAASAADDLRLRALLRWLSLQPELTQDEALAHIAKLPPAVQPKAASTLAPRHPAWVRLAASGLGEVRPDAFRQPEFAAIEWWRAPDVAAPALLRYARDARGPRAATVADEVLARFVQIVDTGWTLPPELDRQLLDVVTASNQPNRWSLLVRALPVEGEERALALWERLGDADRRAFAQQVVQQQRPWHRVFARRLGMVDRLPDQVAWEILDRDWTGAPPEAIAALGELARRFPREVGGGPHVQQALVETVRDNPNLPATILLPLVETGNRDAFAVLAAREPQRALGHARTSEAATMTRHPQLDGLLQRHGTAADVPLAIRLLESLDNQAVHLGGVAAFLARLGGGRPEVIALGRATERHASIEQQRTDIAASAANEARVADLPALLALLPDLRWRVAERLRDAIEPQLGPEHAPALAAALAAEQPLSPGAVQALFVVLPWTGAAGDASALPAVRRVLERVPAAQTDLLREAAGTALAIAGEQRAVVVRELLSSPHPEVVAVALTAAELREDAELRAAATSAVLRLADRIELSDSQFAALAPADARALALALLASERFPATRQGTALAALRALRQTGAEPERIARAARHPDAFVRVGTAEALGQTFTRDAAPFLIELLKDPFPKVREQARQALDELAQYLDAREQWEKRLK